MIKLNINENEDSYIYEEKSSECGKSSELNSENFQIFSKNNRKNDIKEKINLNIIDKNEKQLNNNEINNYKNKKENNYINNEKIENNNESLNKEINSELRVKNKLKYTLEDSNSIKEKIKEIENIPLKNNISLQSSKKLQPNSARYTL